MAKLKAVARYIAYLDILGFRDMLRDEDFPKKIAQIVEVLDERTAFDQSHHPYLKYLAVSDTIIVLAEDNHAPDLCWKISQIQNALLACGFCLRGGISYGDVLLYEDREIKNIFGQTFVEAYVAESEYAIYPRVVVREDIVSKIRDEFISRSKPTADIFLLRDSDGVTFVNQFARDVISARESATKSKNLASRHKKELSAAIKGGLSRAATREKMKWNLLRNQHKTQFRDV